MWELARKWGTLILMVSLLLSLGKPSGATKKGLFLFQSRKDELYNPLFSSFSYDFYHDKCPQAEKIIRSTLRDLFSASPRISAALLRLVFHDCFIQGCDASILLDAVGGNESEKRAIPNQSVKGFDVIDIIKRNVEEACPATVSCADIIVLAAREALVLAGGPFYPLFTGRRDSLQSFYEFARDELPSPGHNISQTLTSFHKRGFDERDTVVLLGGHSIGIVSCHFIRDRLYNFDHTGGPDPSIDLAFLDYLRVRCGPNDTQIASTGTIPDKEPGMEMNDRLPQSGFDSHYYRSLLEGRGILHADQQLMASNRTAALVEGYASDDGSAFRRDFALVMVKLSGLGVLSGSQGEIRLNCSRLNVG